MATATRGRPRGTVVCRRDAALVQPEPGRSRRQTVQFVTNVQFVPKGDHSLATAYSNCPRCGRKMILAAQSGGKGPAIMQCPTCDFPDPLKSESVEGWINSSLRPPA